MQTEELIIPQVGEDDGGRIDWTRIKNTLALEHEAERNANRRRGQQTFNQLIKQGTPYADALKQAADSGLFYDNSDGYMRAMRDAAAMEAKAKLPVKPIYRTVAGRGLVRIPDGGEPEVVMPEVRPAPTIATIKDPISGASLRLNPEQLRQEQIKSTIKERSEMEPETHFIGDPTYNADALGRNTAQLKALRLSGEKQNSAPAQAAEVKTTEIIRKTKDGRRVVYDSVTKKPIRYAD